MYLYMQAGQLYLYLGICICALASIEVHFWVFVLFLYFGFFFLGLLLLLFVIICAYFFPVSRLFGLVCFALFYFTLPLLKHYLLLCKQAVDAYFVSISLFFPCIFRYFFTQFQFLFRFFVSCYCRRFWFMCMWMWPHYLVIVVV